MKTLKRKITVNFHYWGSPDTYPVTVNTPLIKDDVIAFLDAHLK